jgi:hypothetical protein
MRLQAEGAPDAADGRLRHAGFLSHRARLPLMPALVVCITYTTECSYQE